jgi:hypothetical protein
VSPVGVNHPLDLAKWPTGVGNRIPVLSVPAVRRERHRRWPAYIADRIPPVAVLAAQRRRRRRRLTHVGDRVPPLPVLAIERLRRAGCRGHERQGGDWRKRSHQDCRTTKELTHGLSLPQPGDSQTAGMDWANPWALAGAAGCGMAPFEARTSCTRALTKAGQILSMLDAGSPVAL